MKKKLFLLFFMISAMIFANTTFIDDYRVNSLDKNPANLYYNDGMDIFMRISMVGENIKFIYNNGFFKLSGVSYIYDPNIVDSLGTLKYSSPLFYGKGLSLGFSYNIHSYSDLSMNLWFNAGLSYHLNDIAGISLVYQNIGGLNNPLEKENMISVFTLNLSRNMQLQALISGLYDIEEYGFNLNLIPLEGVKLSLYYKSGPNDDIIGGALSFGFGNMQVSFGNDHTYQTANEYNGSLSFGTKPGPRLRPSENTVHLKIGGEYGFFSSTSFFNRKNSVFELLGVLQEIKKDKRVKNLIITLKSNDLSYSASYQIAQIIAGIRNSGKDVIFYFTEGMISMKDYFIAIQGDRIYAHPHSTFNISGIYSTSFHYKNILKFLKVDAQILRPDDCIYKSASETYTESSPSKEAIENRMEIMRTFYDIITLDIAMRREINLDTVKKIMDDNPIIEVKRAIEYAFADEEIYEDDFEKKYLKKIKKYQKRYVDEYYSPQISVAVIPFNGIILPSGTHSPLLEDYITLEKYNDIFKKVEKNKNIKAVIIYVNSPGGDAFESEKIHNRVKKLMEKGKKVYVFMDAVAASGGYYISAYSDSITLTPFTITGSIGIFGGKIFMGDLYNLLKMNHFTLKIGARADYFSPLSKWDNSDMQIMKRHLDVLYERFKDVVAGGRGLSKLRVSTIAGGRVYSGDKAVENKLADRVDTFNGLLHHVFEEIGEHYDERKLEVFDFKWGFFKNLRYLTSFPDLMNSNFWMLYPGD